MLSRRTLLKAAAAAATPVVIDSVTGPRSSAQASQSTSAEGWVDAHSHIWTRDVDKYPLAKDKTLEDLAPASFTSAELMQLARAEGVNRVVLISHFPYYGYDNSYLFDTAAEQPDTFRVVAALDEKLPQVEKRMRDLLGKRVTGFRVTPFVSGETWLDSQGMEQMWTAAVSTGQAMCCLINPQHLAGVEKMCERHRATQVVIDHFARVGMNSEIKEDELQKLASFSRFENVCVKISAFYALGAKKPPYHDLTGMIKRLYDAFGPQRLMWASDAPYQTVGDNSYRASISLVRDHLNFLSETDRAWLMGKTAAKVFFQ